MAAGAVSRPINVNSLANMKRVMRRMFLRNRNFSIMANNCIGGFIYQYYGLEYRTPTLGLFFTSEDYFKFLENIKYYLSQKLVFIKPEESAYYDHLKKANNYGNYPVAKLGDIEVFFMHYKTQEEAASKWYRRIDKINWDNLVVIYAGWETHEYLQRFDKLPFRNKIFFTRKHYDDIKSAVYIKDMETKWITDIGRINKYFNLKKFLNNAPEHK